MCLLFSVSTSRLLASVMSIVASENDSFYCSCYEASTSVVISSTFECKNVVFGMWSSKPTLMQAPQGRISC